MSEMPARSPSRAAVWLTGFAGLLVLGVAGWLAFSPCVSRSVEPVAPGRPLGSESCAGSLVSANGNWVLLILAIPLAVSVAGFIAARLGEPFVLYALGGFLIVFCALAVFSIGLFFLPVGLLLLVAAGLTHIARDRVRQSSSALMTPE